MDFTAVLPNGNPAGGIAAFDAAAAAPEFTPLPPGVYTARVARGDITQTKAGAEAYRMRFAVAEGEHEGQTVLRTWTFGAKALPFPLGIAAQSPHGEDETQAEEKRPTTAGRKEADG